MSFKNMRSKVSCHVCHYRVTPRQCALRRNTTCPAKQDSKRSARSQKINASQSNTQPVRPTLSTHENEEAQVHGTPIKQQLDPLTSSDERDIAGTEPAPEVEENVRMSSEAVLQPPAQKLTPLMKDEIEWAKTTQPTPQDEADGVVIVNIMKYQAPRPHRRRPGNAFAISFRNFRVECEGLLESIKDLVVKPKEPSMPGCFNFTLSNDAILAFDKAHPPPGRDPPAAWLNAAYDVLLFFVDRVYEGKAIERFWFLETVARMPYFAYSTCLHLYETLGWWRTGGLRLVHFAEEWNELHHLLIMEALGGDRNWQDRFLGQHAAVFYYWALVVVFLLSPKSSYKFSEMLETHAVSTYRQFIIENADKLKKLPAPKIAKQYYLSNDPYLYKMDSALCRGPVQEDVRSPPCATLYDVFVNILEDEWEHVKTMVMCQDYDLLETLKVTQTEFTPDEGARRALWNKWAEDIGKMDKMIELRKW